MSVIQAEQDDRFEATTETMAFSPFERGRRWAGVGRGTGVNRVSLAAPLTASQKEVGTIPKATAVIQTRWQFAPGIIHGAVRNAQTPRGPGD